MFAKNNKIIFLVLAGTILRLYLALLPGFKFDMDAWFSWALRLNEVGFNNFYSSNIWTNYTPGYLYVLALLGFLKNFLSLNNDIFYYILKLPAIFAEVSLGILIYKLVAKKATIKLANLSAALVLLNPAFIFNSSVWGQVDGLLTLFMVLSVYYLNKNQLVLSSLNFALALLIKPQALFLLPVYFLFIIKNFNFKNLIKLFAPGILFAISFSLPFFLNKPLTGLLELILQMTKDYSATSLFAYNFWGVVGFWIDDSTLWLNFSYRNWGIILIGIYWIFIFFLYLRKTISLYALATIALLSFYFLPTRVHERYLYLAIPFIILLFSLYKSKIIFSLTILISLLHFINLYFVYIYYNILYLKIPLILYLPQIFETIQGNNKSLSFMSTLIFLIISYYILKFEYARKNS